MAKMTPEILTEELKRTCGGNLCCVVLYGSAVAGDSVKTSDYNVLVVLNRVDAEGLQALTGLCARWDKDGNPAPLLFAKETLLRSADVFPVEFSDIIQTHKVLHGADPFAGMKIEPANLRLELEHELKSKVILLTGRFLVTRGVPGEVDKLMVSSLSAFLTLFKAALRLYGDTPPAKKMEVLPLLAKRVKFDEEIFSIVWELKEGRKRPGLDSAQIFSRYLAAVQGVTGDVDLWLQKAGK
jgi:predicted nucleotidyltransferase